MSPNRSRRRALTEGWASAAVRGRWLMLVFVAVLVGVSLLFLPTLAATTGRLAAVLGQANSPTQLDVVRRFGFPLLSRTAVVQRDPQGLSRQVVAESVQHALEVNRRTLSEENSNNLLFAVPVPNSPRAFPGPNEQITTIVTYLFADPDVSLSAQYRAARHYAERLDESGGHVLGVSGTVPLRLEQVQLVQGHIRWVEIAAVCAVALIVGVSFRSVVAPLVTLLAAGVAYFLAVRIVATGALLFGVTVPALLEPVLVALVLGLTTDYSIFFLSGMRRRLREGQDGRSATRGAVVEYLPIVLVAGLTVTAGVLALMAAQTKLFRTFGPGLAATVLTALLVAVLLVPPLLAVLGRWAFWPGQAARPSSTSRGEPRGRSGRLLRPLTRRGPAAVVTVLVVGVLLAAAAPLLRLRESVLPMASLPTGNSVYQVWRGAAEGFAPGILSPTEVIVARPGIAGDTEQLVRLQHRLIRQPGVTAVIGPTDVALPDPLLGRAGLFLAPDGDAARFLVVFDADPLGALAIDHLDELQERMPRLLDTTGLGRAEVIYVGDTPLALELVRSASGDYVRVAVAIALIDLLLLVIFLRALVAPLYLMVSSFLSVMASLGLTTLVFQVFLEQEGLIFFIPFAAGVLLVSLGADYLVFSVSQVWRVARDRPLDEALLTAVPRSTQAISAAGITLAASFGFVALVPIVSFRELAFVMGVGVLIDSFVVRPLLVPALISLFGRAGAWPGKHLRSGRPTHNTEHSR